MKFQPDFISVQSISGYGAGWVSVGQEKIASSIVLGSQGERFAWDCDRFESLGPAHFAQRFIDVLLAERPAPANPVEDFPKPVA